LQIAQSLGSIGLTQREIAGIAPARELMRLVQLTQHHRGLSAAMLGGDGSAAKVRDTKYAEVEQAFAQFDRRFGNGAPGEAAPEPLPANLTQSWQRASKAWRELNEQVAAGRLDAAQSTQRHTALITEYFNTLGFVLDHWKLSLDAHVDAHYLIYATLGNLPHSTEALGQTRARGAGLLAAHAASPEERALLAGTIKAATDQFQGMTLAFDKAFAVNAALEAELSGRLNEAKKPIQDSIALAQKEILETQALQYPGKDYFNAFTRAIDQLYALNDVALGALERQLKRHIADRHQSEALRLGLLGALLVGIGWLGILIERSVTRPLARAVTLAERVAQGDLSGANRQPRGRDEITQLMHALAAMRESLRQVVGGVRDNVARIDTASGEIAQGNVDLSSRTEQQAASLQETAASMEELSSTVKQNADNARQANQLAASASEVAERGGAAVSDVVRTMDDISASSRRIAEIVSVIDGIAFQTNILALNAAVEAARAGEQGKGFAVVAGEVRTLAQRSATAAKEIKGLIDDSAGKVTVGASQVERAGATMREIVASVRRVTDIMGEIAAASQEQARGIEQVNQAVTQMDQAPPQHAALVEQAAAAAGSLREQTQSLSSAVGVFKVA
jgi:methyl-accepting chemotaxis protein